MAIYKPPKLKNAKEFLTDKKVNRSSPEEYYEVTSQKFSLYDPDTAYSGSQRAKQEKESEKRLSLPKVNLQELRDNSVNQFAEYLPQEEVSRLNRIAHQGEQPKQSLMEKLTSNVTDENRATLGVEKKPSAPRVNSQVATLAGKQPEQYSQQQSAEGGRFQSDGNIKGQVANTEQKKTDIGALGRSLRDLPRNIGAAAVNTYDNLRKSGILPGGAEKQKVMTEEEFRNSNAITKKGYGTYENYLKLVSGLNESPQMASSEKIDKVVEGLQEKLPSKVDDDTTLWEKMVRGAATSWLPSMASASLGGGLAGMAGQFSSNPIIIEAMRTAPLFTSGTDSGLKTAEELGLTGAKKYSYAVLSGLLEAGTERLSSLGLEGKLLGKKTSGGVGGAKEFLRAIFEESGSEMLNEVGQQLLTGQYTNYEDFELDFENIIVAGGSAALMGGFGAVGELSNGLKYRTVGTVDNQVIIETEDGRRENVNPEIVMRHQLANGRTARMAQEMLKADTEIQELAKTFGEQEQTTDTMPVEDTTTPQEAFEVETEPSMPIEEKPLTEPLNEVETVSVNEIDKVIGKPKGEKNVDYLEYYEVVKNFPEYAFKADDDFIDVVEGMEIQARGVIEEAIKGKDTFKAELKNGQYIIVHPSTKNGEMQVSFFDDKGAIMDEQMKRSELIDRLIEAKVLPKDITDEGVATPTEPQTYTYAFRTRGLSPGAQPKGFISDNPSEGKFGSVTYDRPLTEKEIKDYELVPTKKTIPPPETELQANEEKLNNMIEKNLIDTKRKRDVAKSLNQKIVEQGGQDRLEEIEPKKEEIPKPKKAEPQAEIDKAILESVRKEQERTRRTIAGTERFPDEKVELPKVKTVTIGEHKGTATIVDIPIRGKQKGEVLFKPLAGHSFEVIEGYPVVIANNAGKWQTLDKQTGLLFNGGYSSRKAALEDYLAVYKKYHEKAISGGLIEKNVEEFKAAKENQAKAKKTEKEIEPKKVKVPKPSNMKYDKGFKITSQELDSGSIVPRTEYEVLGFGTEWQGARLSDKPGYIVRENSVGSDYKTVSIVDEKIIDMIVDRNAQTESEYQAVQSKAKSDTERASKYEEVYKIDKFTEGNTPIQKGKTLQTLNKKLNYDGKVMTRAEFVYDSVVTQGKEVFTDINKKFDDKLGKWVDGKAYYGIRNEDNSYNIITKAEYDYARFLNDTDIISSDDDLMVNNMAMEAEIEPMEQATREEAASMTEFDLMDEYRESKTKQSMQNSKFSGRTKKIAENVDYLYKTVTFKGESLKSREQITGRVEAELARLETMDKENARFTASDTSDAIMILELSDNLLNETGDAYWAGVIERAEVMRKKILSNFGQGLVMGKMTKPLSPRGTLIALDTDVTTTMTPAQKKGAEKINKEMTDILTDVPTENGRIKLDATEIDTFVDTIMERFPNMKKNWGKQWKKQLAEGNVTKAEILDSIYRASGVPRLSVEAKAEILEHLEAMSGLEQDSTEYNIHNNEIKSIIRWSRGIGFWTKLSALQTYAMLGNAKTGLKNELGNWIGFSMGQFDAEYSEFFDKQYAKTTGQRTVADRGKGIEYAKGYKEGVKRSFQDFKNKTDSRQNSSKYFDDNVGRVFKYQNGGYARILVDLVSGDNKVEAAKQFATHSAAKAENLTKFIVDDRRHAFARYEMSRAAIEVTDATIRETNKGLPKEQQVVFSKEEALANLEKEIAYYTFNNKTAGAKILTDAVKALNKFSTRGATTEFGAGTLLAKFTKTPMNIIAFTTDHLGWDYATARRQYKESYKELKKTLPKPEAKKEAIQLNQRGLATSKAKALTGATFIGTGMMLAALGGITPNRDDEDERLLLEAQGYKSGYLNMSGLARNLLGGGGDKIVYDYNTGDIQDGDTLISINQFAPGGAFMLLGARIMDYLTAEEADKSFGNILTATLQGAIDSSTDLVDLPFNRTASMIINEFKYADYKEDGTTEALLNVGNKLLGSTVTSFIPAPVKQTSQLLDPYAKSYSRDSGEAVKEQIMANIPTMRDDVPYAFYINGEPIQYSGEKNAIEALWSAYVAPYYKSVVKYDKPLKSITDSVAKNKVSPPTLAPNKITYSGSEYDLSKEERQEYQKAYWKTYEKTRDTKKASTSAKIDYFKRNKIKFELDKNGDLKKIK